MRIPRTALVEWLAVQNDQARASVETETVSLADLFPAENLFPAKAGLKTVAGAFAGMGEILAALPIRDRDAELRNFCRGLGIPVPAPTQSD